MLTKVIIHILFIGSLYIRVVVSQFISRIYNIIHKLFEIFAYEWFLILYCRPRKIRTFFYYYISGSKFNNLFDMRLFPFAILPDFALDYEGFIYKWYWLKVVHWTVQYITVSLIFTATSNFYCTNNLLLILETFSVS